ncbi:MAG: (2Fe-2S)-binding protein [Deltaproteobacteria bacterium]|nr:(2Fe-2S)-binding protein [Deltaproteobacteria bacterium]MBW2151218.1 (2Fe-2S)-binding protein [Deltaproteobacteria bacterium]
MEQKPKIQFTIDGKEVLVDEGATILEAAQINDIHIPTLCHHKALSNYGGCRMCVVEVDGSPKLVASCVTPVRNGMEVVTSNDYIIECRRTILEYIFAERNHNCMFCPQSGDCELQNLAYELQMDHLTVSFSFNQFPTDVTSEYMAIDHNRCILCGRCVRACKEIAGASVLHFMNRGPESLISMDLNESRKESTCYSCGICVQVCPTGAMVNRYRSHYAVKGHPKDYQKIESICPQCGLLCPTVSFTKDNNLIKIEGKMMSENGRPDRGQLCWRGRFEVLKSNGKRLLRPMVRNQDGTWREERWEAALDLVAGKLNTIRNNNGIEAIFGLASSAAANEELIFFRDLMIRGWSAGHMDTLDGVHFRAVHGTRKDSKGRFREDSWQRIPEADLVILFGASPYHSQPVISSLLRKGILESGMNVVVFGRTDHISPYTPYYFPVENRDLPLLIQALRTKVMNKDDAPGILEKAGLENDAVKAFHEVAEALSDSVNPLFIAGPTLTGLETPSALCDVVRLAHLKGLLPDNALRLIILKPFGNSAGAWKLGISSTKEPPNRDRWKAGLILLSEADGYHVPALEELHPVDFLAVISPCFPENLADKAHVLIPKPLWMEEEGTFTSLEGCETAYKKSVLRPPEGVRDSWQTFWSLAQRIGFHPDYKSREELSERAEREIRSER